MPGGSRIYIIEVFFAALGDDGTCANFIMPFTLLPTTFVNIKRCHDLGHSGWYYMLFPIPFVNIWLAIELSFLSGDAGPNQFGEKP